MLLCIVAVAAIMFIFIPEFIGLGVDGRPALENFSLDFPNPHQGREKIENAAAATVVSRTSAKVPVNESLVAELQEKPSLEQLAHLIDNGYIDHLVQQRRSGTDADKPAKLDLTAGKASLNPAAIASLQSQDTPGDSDPELLPPPRQEIPEGLEFLVQNNQIDWPGLKSRPVRRVFSRLENDATTLLTKVPQENLRSRIALMNYISALSKIPDSGERAMSAPEAVAYLNMLDVEVTKSLKAENAPRIILHEWAKLSLSPILGRQNTDVLREKSVPTFNPNPTIVRAHFHNTSADKGRLTEDGLVFAAIKLRVSGIETVDARLLRNDNLYRSAPLKPESELNQSVKYVDFTHLPLPAKYTVILKDTFGNEHRKHYYLERPKLRGWTYDPGSNQWHLKLPQSQDNPAVDKLFRSSGPGKKSSTTFGLFAGGASGMKLSSSF